MTKNQTTTLIVILLIISALLSLTGYFFKLQHYPNGPVFIKTGIVFWLILIAVILFSFARRKKEQKTGLPK